MCPIHSNQLVGKLLIFLYRGTQGPVSLGTEVGLDPSFIPGVIDTFLDHINFLDSLHINNKGICQKPKKKKRKGNR